MKQHQKMTQSRDSNKAANRVFVGIAGDALFQTHENLEHLAMMEAVLGAIPERIIKEANRTAGRYFTYRWPSLRILFPLKAFCMPIALLRCLYMRQVVQHEFAAQLCECTCMARGAVMPLWEQRRDNVHLSRHCHGVTVKFKQLPGAARHGYDARICLHELACKALPQITDDLADVAVRKQWGPS